MLCFSAAAVGSPWLFPQAPAPLVTARSPQWHLRPPRGCTAASQLARSLLRLFLGWLLSSAQWRLLFLGYSSSLCCLRNYCYCPSLPAFFPWQPVPRLLAPSCSSLLTASPPPRASRLGVMLSVARKALLLPCLFRLHRAPSWCGANLACSPLQNMSVAQSLQCRSW